VTNTDRTRDLTPTHAFAERPDGTRQEIPNSGGAGRFLDFFAQELIPYIEQHYRALPYRIFAGHSLGGLFALSALAVRPELFQAYIAASPSLQYDNNYPLRVLETLFKERKELRRTLYATMANEETGTPAPTLFDRLQGILAAAKASGFEWGAKLMAEETHGTVVLRSHYWGLRKIFETWPLPVGPNGLFTGSLDDLKKHFAGISERFGFTVVPPEDTVNAAGYGSLLSNNSSGAIALFTYNVEIHPNSANVYDSLGEALERAGRLKEAHASYAKAVENAARDADARLAVFTANRDRAAAALLKQEKDK
jgi:pimeloyl-ACP methyl ester carboxylesterase